MNTLGLLERTRLRKAASDAGFDVLHDEPECVRAASTHAPLRAWVAAEDGGYRLGLSMGNVLRELHLPAAAAALSVGGAGWVSLPDLPALDACLSRAWQLSRTLPDELVHRFAAAVETLGATEREATARQRVGQDLFREGLLTLWEGRCAITGLDVPALLRASHAKPWADATDAERLDVYNGLLLAAHLDAAFDAGLITLDADGVVRPSSRLVQHAKTLLGLNEPKRVRLQLAHQPYMAWHRENVWHP